MIIVHVLTRLLKAGSEENTYLSAVAQRRAGHDVYVVYGAEADPGQVQAWGRDLAMVQISSMVHPLNPLKDARATLDMARQFRRLKPDIVHTHQSKAGIVGRMAARLAGVKTVIHGVHIIPFEQVGFARKLVYLSAEHLCASLTHAFVHVSESSRQTYIDKGIGKSLPHAVVRSGMDLGRFRNAQWPADWQAITGASDPASVPPVLLLIGALEPRKRHLELIAALKVSKFRPDNLLVLFAGTGPMESQVRAAIAEAGLESQIRLLGFRRDPESLIALSRACLSVGEREGLPRVVIQYLAGNRPAFVTRTMGLDRLIAEHPLCSVYAPEDMQGQVDDACRALSAPVAAEQSGDTVRLLDAWDVPAFVQGLEQVYTGARTR